jgi:hypothetical protein
MSVERVCAQCRTTWTVPQATTEPHWLCPACSAESPESAGEAEAIVVHPDVGPRHALMQRPTAPPDREEDEADDARPRRWHRFREPPAPFRKVYFNVRVLADSPLIERGRYLATLDEYGLLLRRGGETRLDIPVGARAVFQGKNCCRIVLKGWDFELSVHRPQTYQVRFTQALVDFINGDLARIDAADYQIPYSLFCFVILPCVAIYLVPFAVVFGAPVAIANYFIILQEDWRPATRISLAAVLTGLVFAFCIVLFVLLHR